MTVSPAAIAAVKRVERIGDATLLLGNCLDILPHLGPVDAVVTDPPYGMKTEEWDNEAPLWALPLIERTLRPGGACYWFGLPPAVWTVAMAGPLKFKREIVWWHQTGYPATKNWRLATETIIFMTRGDPDYFDVDSIREGYAPRPERPNGRPDRQNSLGKSPGNVIQCPRPAPRHDDESDHPHAKPLNLLRSLILASCPPFGSVCDPFMGSASTGVACANLGRSFIGIEINEGYFDIACRRIEAAYKQPDFFIERPAPAVQQPLFTTGAAE